MREWTSIRKINYVDFLKKEIHNYYFFLFFLENSKNEKLINYYFFDRKVFFCSIHFFFSPEKMEAIEAQRREAHTPSPDDRKVQRLASLLHAPKKPSKMEAHWSDNEEETTDADRIAQDIQDTISEDGEPLVADHPLNLHTTDKLLMFYNNNVKLARDTLQSIQRAKAAMEIVECTQDEASIIQDTIRLTKSILEESEEKAETLYVSTLAQRMLYADSLGDRDHPPSAFLPPMGIPPILPETVLPDHLEIALTASTVFMDVFDTRILSRIAQERRLFQLLLTGKEKQAQSEFGENIVSTAKIFIQSGNIF